MASREDGTSFFSILCVGWQRLSRAWQTWPLAMFPLQPSPGIIVDRDVNATALAASYVDAVLQRVMLAIHMLIMFYVKKK